MTVKASIGRASEITADGGLLAIPGLANGTYRLDQHPHFFNSPAMTVATSAVTAQGNHVAPCNMTIVGLVYNSTTSVTATAATLNIGTIGTATNYGVVTLATGTGVVTATGLDGTAITKGDVICFGLGVSTAGGVVSASLIAVPRNT